MRSQLCQPLSCSDQPASWLANVIVEVFAPLGLYPIIAAFANLAVILTQPISNAAAVLVLLPVAISTSEILDMNARPFAIIVIVLLVFLVPMLWPFQ